MNYYYIDTCYEAIENTKKMNEMNRHRDRSLGSSEGKALSYILQFINRFNKAVVQMNNRQYSESLKSIQFVISSKPDLTEGYYIMGITCNKIRDFEKSVPSLERAAWLIKRGYRKEISAIDVFTALYDSYVNQQPPDHNNGMRALEHLLFLYPNDLRQLFNYYHIKQYISALNGLVPLKRQAFMKLQSQKDKYITIAKEGILPPLTPIRASVMASLSLQSEVNALYEVYAHATAKNKQYKHPAVKGK